MGVGIAWISSNSVAKVSERHKFPFKILKSPPTAFHEEYVLHVVQVTPVPGMYYRELITGQRSPIDP